MNWKQLICNTNGEVSRTQCTLIVLYVYTLLLTTAEILVHVLSWGNILTIPVGISLFMLFIFAFIDRLNASRLNLQFNKTGVQIEADNHNG